MCLFQHSSCLFSRVQSSIEAYWGRKRLDYCMSTFTFLYHSKKKIHIFLATYFQDTFVYKEEIVHCYFQICKSIKEI